VLFSKFANISEQMPSLFLEREQARSKRMALAIGLLCGGQYGVLARVCALETRYCPQEKRPLKKYII